MGSHMPSSEDLLTGHFRLSEITDVAAPVSVIVTVPDCWLIGLYTDLAVPLQKSRISYDSTWQTGR